MSQGRAAGTQQGPSAPRGTLGPRGTGTPGGPREGWPHIRAVVGHTRRPPGRRCRREVCPEAAACCPPSQPSTSPQVVPPMCAQLEI